MIRFNKLATIFSFRFWKQLYHLFTSFLVGNVWSQTKLGQIGKGVDINPTVRFGNYPENIFLGQNISIGYGTHIYAGPNSKVTIGDNTMIGPYVFITTEAFSESKDNPEGVHSGHSGDVEIGINVRIGAHSNILPGVRIGADSSTGAASVVTKNVSSNSVVVGNPAKRIKTIK